MIFVQYWNTDKNSLWYAKQDTKYIKEFKNKDLRITPKQ